MISVLCCAQRFSYADWLHSPLLSLKIEALHVGDKLV